MKFIIDAQLPPTLKHFFQYRGYDAIHWIYLNRTIPQTKKYVALRLVTIA